MGVVVSFNDLISYTGKRVVVTGAASGMGLATIKYLADLGAEISALDRNPVEDGPWDFIEVDLGSQMSIDSAVAKIGGPVNALFNVAGIAGGRGKEKATMMINFFGHRYLTESLLPLMTRGGAVVNVSSLAGYRYFVDKDELAPMLELVSMDEASAWLDDNEDKFNGYGTSKELQNLWTAVKCQDFAEKYGIRINAVGPGSTDTPLLEAFKANAIERTGSDAPVLAAKGFLGRFQHAEEQAAACVFLNSDAATSITGQVLYVDGGRAGAIMSGVLPLPAPRGR
jgi:NAD(P)-dependent dehydrogenase (short-subunit alcohol dehydrogenase family)